jgi:hypothetical protein
MQLHLLHSSHLATLNKYPIEILCNFHLKKLRFIKYLLLKSLLLAQQRAKF